jgi:C-terminal processing protease CtpA/Prc
MFPASRFGQMAVQGTINSAITNPISFAKNHFTGGIGALMISASPTTLPAIAQVVAGSPAEKAGLRAGDVILQINGVTTRGESLSQVVENIRGFTAGAVTLTIQRAGSTNLQFVVRRTSWNSLGVPR